MNYDFEHIKDMIGTLTTLDESTIIPDVAIEMNTPTAKKLAAVLRSNKVTKDHQNLFFNSISISRDFLDVFIKGQCGMVKDGNKYIMTTIGRTPIRFKGIMQTLVRGDDGFDYACDIEIGNIAFNIGDREPQIYDDVAVFKDVSAIIYPYGTYRAIVQMDER